MCSTLADITSEDIPNVNVASVLSGENTPLQACVLRSPAPFLEVFSLSV